MSLTTDPISTFIIRLIAHIHSAIVHRRICSIVTVDSFQNTAGPVTALRAYETRKISAIDRHCQIVAFLILVAVVSDHIEIEIADTVVRVWNDAGPECRETTGRMALRVARRWVASSPGRIKNVRTCSALTNEADKPFNEAVVRIVPARRRYALGGRDRE